MFPFDSPEDLFSFNNLSIGVVGDLAGLSGEKENSPSLWEKYEKRLPGNVAPTLSASVPPKISSSEPMADVRTILLTGLPADFKEREVVNLFTFAEGFEQCALSLNGCAYIRFTTQDSALQAIQVLDGRLIDTKNRILIRAELNTSNLIIDGYNSLGGNVGSSASTIVPSASATPFTVSSASSFYFHVNQPAPSTAPTPSLTRPSRTMTISVPGLPDPTVIQAPFNCPSGSNDLAAPIPIPNTQLIGSLSSQRSIEAQGQVQGQIQASPSPTIQQPQQQHQQQQPVKVQQSLPLLELSNFQRNLIAAGQLGTLAAVVGENFPCNTLYVGNLPPTAAAEELRFLFKHCFGYRRLSFKPKSSGPMCFVEFEDIACATAALETLYGTMLSCSNSAKGGIRLSYSKNPLGLRVASPVCDVSILGNVHAVSSLIKIDVGNMNGMSGMSNMNGMSGMNGISINNNALNTLNTMTTATLPNTVITNFHPTRSPNLNLSPLLEIPEHRAAITNIISHYNKQR